MEGILRILDVSFGGRNLTVANLRHFAVVAFALCHFGLMFQLLDTRFLILDSSHIAFLLIPPRVEFFGLLLEVRQLLFDGFQLGIILIAFDSLALNLQLLDLTIQRIDLFRFGIDLQTQLGGCFID